MNLRNVLTTLVVVSLLTGGNGDGTAVLLFDTSTAGSGDGSALTAKGDDELTVYA